MKRILISAILLMSGHVLAQGPQDSISEDDMRQRIQQATEMAERAVTAKSKLTTGQKSVATNFDRIPMPASAGYSNHTVDVEAIAKKINSTNLGLPKAAALFAFVSFSMPKPSLERMVADAERYGVTLVVRGLVNRSLKDTAQAARELIGRRKVGWLIDPQAFRRFGVQSVPSYVLVRSNALPHACALARECFDDGDFVRVVGDVTTAYALEQIALAAPGMRGDVDYIASKGVSRP